MLFHYKQRSVHEPQILSLKSNLREESQRCLGGRLRSGVISAPYWRLTHHNNSYPASGLTTAQRYNFAILSPQLFLRPLRSPGSRLCAGAKSYHNNAILLNLYGRRTNEWLGAPYNDDAPPMGANLQLRLTEPSLLQISLGRSGCAAEKGGLNPSPEIPPS